MNKTILYAVIFVVLAVVIGLFIKGQSGNTFGNSENSFAIKDTDKIHRIFIGDRNDNKIELIKQPNGTWELNGKYKARKEAIELLLETIQKIDILYILPDAAKQGVYREFQEKSHLVRLFDKDNNKLKGYQIGDIAADNQGTHAMMEGAEQPYVVHIPIWEGHLQPRYMVSERDWRDRTVFEVPYDKIESVSVEYPNQRAYSFILNQKNGKYSVKPFYETTTKINKDPNKAAVQQYLTGFKRLVAETIKKDIPRQLLENKDVLPFCSLNLKTTDGTEKRIDFYPIPTKNVNTEGISPLLPNGTPERYFATSENEVFLVQHLVFMKVFASYGNFFPK